MKAAKIIGGAVAVLAAGYVVLSVLAYRHVQKESAVLHH